MFITDKDNRTRLQTNIETTLHHRFKTACFLKGKGMNEILSELIACWLESNEPDILVVSGNGQENMPSVRENGKDRE